MISRSPRCTMGTSGSLPARRRRSREGRRRATALRRRRRKAGASTRSAPIRANGSRNFPSPSATKSGSPRTRPHDCHSATMSSPRRPRRAAATEPGRHVQARQQSRKALLPYRRKGGSRRRDRRRRACSAPCACHAPSGAAPRARDAGRRRTAAHRPPHRQPRNARAKRRGRAATRGSTRQRSCRLPFDASNLLPPGCCRPVVAMTMPWPRRDRLKKAG